jgi:transposase-like protein
VPEKKTATLCPRCGSADPLLVTPTMLRIFYLCHACGKTFAVLAAREPTDAVDRQRSTVQ